jgi:hypothetical protein
MKRLYYFEVEKDENEDLKDAYEKDQEDKKI